MADQFANSGSLVRSVRPVRDVLIIEPMQQHLGLSSILLLPGTQCTIGSSRACTLTVRTQGILPQHCLIVSGPNSTTLKEFGDSTWLNDRPVREIIELTERDRLAIGPAEFRLRLASPEEIDQAIGNSGSVGTQPEAGDDWMLERQREQLTQQQNRLQHEATELDSREQELRSREQELDDRFRELEDKLSELSTRDVSHTAARELDSQLLALAGSDDELRNEREEIERLRAELQTIRDSQASREDELRNQERLLDRRRADIANQELELEHQRDEFQRTKGELDRLRSQYARQQGEIDDR